MSKKSNSVVFMLVATLVNLLLMVIFFIIGFVVIGLLISSFPSLEESIPILTLAVFVVAIFGSFLVYNKLVKWATERFKLEEKLDPLFTPKRNRRNKLD